MKRVIAGLLLMAVCTSVMGQGIQPQPSPKFKMVANSYILNKIADSLGLEFSDTVWITATGIYLGGTKAYYTNSTAALQAQFKSSNTTDTRVSILNTATGHALLYLDAINGDLGGGDYVVIGQYDDSSMGYDIGASATYAWHEFTVGNAQKLKITNAGVTFGGSAPSTDFTFPLTDGTANQVLRTAGDGTVTWEDQAGAGGGTTDSVYWKRTDSTGSDRWVTPDDTLWHDTTIGASALTYFTEADDNDTSVFTATGPNTTVGFNDQLTMQDNDISGVEKITTDTAVATQINISGDEITDFAGANLSVTAGVLNASGAGLTYFTEADDNDTSVFTAIGPNTTVGFNDQLTMQGNDITGVDSITMTGQLSVVPGTVSGIFINQNNNNYGLEIDHDGSQYGVLLNGQFGMKIEQAFGPGHALNITRSLASENTSMVFMEINNASDGQAVLELNNDGTGAHIVTGGTNEDLEIFPNGTGDVSIISDLVMNDSNITGANKITTDTIVATQINISGDEITDLNGGGLKVVGNVLMADTADAVADAEVKPVSGNAVYDYLAGSGVLFNNLGDPDDTTKQAFGTKGIQWNFTNAADFEGSFEFNITGNSSNDGLHIHQHTGNPTGGHLIHAESEDPDVMPLCVRSGMDSVAAFGSTGGSVEAWIDTNGIYHGDLDADTIDISGDKIIDFNGGGLTVASNVLAVTDDIQNHTLDSAEVMTIIADTTIQLADMATNSVDSNKLVDVGVSLPEDVAPFTEVEIETKISDATALFTNNTAGDVTVSGGTSANTTQAIVSDDVDSTAEAFVFSSAYHVTSAVGDSIFVSKKYVDDAAGGLTTQSVKGDHVDSVGEGFAFDQAYHITTAEADSAYVTAKQVSDSALLRVELDGDTMSGPLRTTVLESEGNIFVNKDSTAADAIIQFSDDDQDETIHWDQATSKFEVSDDWDVTGNITVSGTVDTVDVGTLGATVPKLTDDSASWNDHVADNSQAHTDYMLNTGDVATGEYTLDSVVTIKITADSILADTVVATKLVSDSAALDTAVVANALTIPQAQNPTTGALGRIAIDADAGAFEVYDTTHGADHAALIPFSQKIEALVWFPDLVTDTVSIFYVDSLLYPGGIEIVRAEVQMSEDAGAGTYELELMYFTAADPPVLSDFIDTLIVAENDSREQSVTFENSTIAIGQQVYILTPSDDIDWIRLSLTYYVKEND